MPESSEQVTDLLLRWGDGDAQALDRLTAAVHHELHRLAQRYMANERPDHTLQATALVNEAYVRLVDTSRVRWQNRAHFFAMAARLMRQILVDHARRRDNQKRGGQWRQVAFDDVEVEGGGSLGRGPDIHPDLLALNEALDKLAALDPRKAQVVELRFFGGLSLQETAEALHVSTDTVGRDWDAARAWLLRALRHA